MKQKSLFLYVVLLFLLVGCKYETSYSRSKTTKTHTSKTTVRTTITISKSSTTAVEIKVANNTTEKECIVMALNENSVKIKSVTVGKSGIAYFNLDNYLKANKSKMFYFQVFDKVGNSYTSKSYKLPINVQKHYLYQATIIKRD